MTKPKDGCNCPKCGGRLYADGTRRIGSIIRRFVRCESCGAGFITHQDPPRIIREVESRTGQSPLNLVIGGA